TVRLSVAGASPRSPGRAAVALPDRPPRPAAHGGPGTPGRANRTPTPPCLQAAARNARTPAHRPAGRRRGSTSGPARLSPASRLVGPGRRSALPDDPSRLPAGPPGASTRPADLPRGRCGAGRPVAAPLLAIASLPRPPPDAPAPAGAATDGRTRPPSRRA